MDFRLSVLKHVFQDGPGDVLPGLAVQGLEEGYDTPALRQLAGLFGQKHYDPVEVRRLFGTMLREAGLETSDREAIAWELVAYYLDAVLGGRTDPLAGAREIIWGVYDDMPWCDRNTKYAGDSVGMERLYQLVDMCTDLQLSDHRWREDKTNEQLLDETKTEIVTEVRRYRQAMHPKGRGKRP